MKKTLLAALGAVVLALSGFAPPAQAHVRHRDYTIEQIVNRVTHRAVADTDHLNGRKAHFLTEGTPIVIGNKTVPMRRTIWDTCEALVKASHNPKIDFAYAFGGETARVAENVKTEPPARTAERPAFTTPRPETALQAPVVPTHKPQQARKPAAQPREEAVAAHVPPPPVAAPAESPELTTLKAQLQDVNKKMKISKLNALSFKVLSDGYAADAKKQTQDAADFQIEVAQLQQKINDFGKSTPSPATPPAKKT